MGEFLLSILGFDATNSFLVYKRKVHRANFKVNQPVAIAYPNPKRKTTARYYRIYNRFYAFDILHELVRSQDPDVIDQKGFTAKGRAHVDSEVMKFISLGHSYEQIGEQLDWHPEAVKLALVRHKNRLYAEREASPMVADMTTLEYYNPDETPIQPEHLTADQIAKREALLAEWE